ncbi:MAG: GntR family transcriptional regulator [Terriglobia bacterium]|jgi:DNA-binding GntR family transcriptional regulator
MTETLTLDIYRKRPEGLSQWIVETLRGAIYAGKLKPGDRIVEGKLAKTLGVGVSPLREALRQLESLGLVTRYSNRGTYVTQLTPAELSQLYRLRTELESLSVRFAVETPDKPGLETLRTLAGQMRDAGLAGDIIKHFEYDLQFHLQICRIAKNPFLERCLLNLLIPFFAFEVICFRQRPDFLDLAGNSEKHFEIVDLIGGTDVDQATAGMRRLMSYFYEETLKKLFAATQAHSENPVSSNP